MFAKSMLPNGSSIPRPVFSPSGVRGRGKDTSFGSSVGPYRFLQVTCHPAARTLLIVMAGTVTGSPAASDAWYNRKPIGID